MTFLNFWALAIGGAALAAPLVIHFMTRPRPAPIQLSTVHFLSEVIQQRKARSRLRDWMVLLLRILCIALLAFGLSRPLFQAPPVVGTEAGSENARVVILDISQSMKAGGGGVSCWNEAQATALQYLGGSSARANVIFCGATPKPVFDRLSQNLSVLRESVRQAEPTAERADPRSALELAAKHLSSVEATERELVIISDFQRSNWGTLLLEKLPKGTQVQFYATKQVDPRNVSIDSVRLSSNLIAGQAGMIEVDVSNFSEQTTSVKVNLDLGSVQQQLRAQLTPQSSRTLTASVSFEEPGWKFGWARLEDNLDALAEDDERPVAIRVRPSLQVALLSRQNKQMIPSSSFYLHHALRVALGKASGAANPTGAPPSEGNDANTLVHRLHPLRSSPDAWPESDIYVLDHPGALSDAAVKHLSAEMKRGKGILYVTSELVDAINVAKLREVLGAEMQPPVDLVATKQGARRQGLSLRKVNAREKPFDVLGGNAVNRLTPVRFAGGLDTRATAEGLRDQIRAELSDTSALVYVTGVGAGQFAVLNADLGLSNWPVQPSFLPVLSELVSSLLAASSESGQAPTGEPLVRLLPPSISDAADLVGVTLDGVPPNDGEYGKWDWSASQATVTWSWPSPPGAGIYALKDRGVPAWVVAASAPAEEADLTTLEREVLTDRIAQGTTVGFTTTEEQEQQDDDFWSWLIVACTLGLIAEVMLLRFHRM